MSLYIRARSRQDSNLRTRLRSKASQSTSCAPSLGPPLAEVRNRIAKN
jgi:hypothetical protein